MKKSGHPFTKAEQKFIKRMVDERGRVQTRFPLLFGLLITFGFVSILSGFQKLIDSVDLFTNNPWILFVTGLVILILSGAAYKKLN